MLKTRSFFNPVLATVLLLASAKAAAQSAPASAPAAAQPTFQGARPGPSGQPHRVMEEHRQRMRERFEHMRDRLREGRDRRGRIHSAEREMLEELRRQKLNPEDLKQKVLAFQALKDERRREHRARLHSRFGHDLTRPEVKTELEQHGRRVARLHRMEVVAATERDDKQRKALTERIQKLRKQEDQRHQKVIKQLVPNAPEELAEPAPSSLPPRPHGAPAAAAPGTGGALP